MSRLWSDKFSRGNAIYQLTTLANAVVASHEGAFLEHTGLDIRSIRVLRLIGDNPGVTFADIALMATLERSLTSRIIQTLLVKELIVRHNSKRDARRFELYTTPAGDELRGRADALSTLGLDIIFKPLDPDEVKTFLATMDKLARWVDDRDYKAMSRDVFGALPSGEKTTS